MAAVTTETICDISNIQTPPLKIVAKSAEKSVKSLQSSSNEINSTQNNFILRTKSRSYLVHYWRLISNHLLQNEPVPGRKDSDLFAKVEVHNRQCETFCCKSHIWSLTCRAKGCENIGSVKAVATWPQ